MLLQKAKGRKAASGKWQAGGARSARAKEGNRHCGLEEENTFLFATTHTTGMTPSRFDILDNNNAKTKGKGSTHESELGTIFFKPLSLPSLLPKLDIALSQMHAQVNNLKSLL